MGTKLARICDDGSCNDGECYRCRLQSVVAERDELLQHIRRAPGCAHRTPLPDDRPNVTADDARDRMGVARHGSLREGSTLEYLEALLQEIDAWRERVLEAIRTLPWDRRP